MAPSGREGESGSGAGLAAGIPYGPLLLTLAMQTLATMAAFSAPTLAPKIAMDLGVDGHLIGFFVSTVYGVGIASALFSPDFIQKFGAVRVGQFVMLGVVAMLVIAGSGGLGALALCAFVLGSGYGATAPVSTHLLIPRTKPNVLNLVFSIRQIGVPLGGVLGALLLPFVAVEFGWRMAFWVQVLPAVLLIAAFQYYRNSWDEDRNRTHRLFKAELWRPLYLLRDSALMRLLSLASFSYAGSQLCFIGFMALHLTERTGLDLIAAGQVLALYQISGVASRPIWGWLADRYISSIRLLGLLGIVMAFAAIAAGQLSESWSIWFVLLVAVTAGATASGFTGIAYGAFAAFGGKYRTEATALGSSAMFLGVLILPTIFGVIVGDSREYWHAYGLIALIVASSGAWLMLAKIKTEL
ncbi:MFS transporter [Sneathiella chungangensis]|uniref:MFS transporter n=1 Tax=Sneathiella chungangensis TaxID=1418234 RepID=A0A845MI57_9PROT|nr:MFS transporter [Sneathiella chungangensis]MZR23431.1 MFS transporter [Sneathiella chungangensis]